MGNLRFSWNENRKVSNFLNFWPEISLQKYVLLFLNGQFTIFLEWKSQSVKFLEFLARDFPAKVRFVVFKWAIYDFLGMKIAKCPISWIFGQRFPCKSTFCWSKRAIYDFLGMKIAKCQISWIFGQRFSRKSTFCWFKWAIYDFLGMKIAKCQISWIFGQRFSRKSTFCWFKRAIYDKNHWNLPEKLARVTGTNSVFFVPNSRLCVQFCKKFKLTEKIGHRFLFRVFPRCTVEYQQSPVLKTHLSMTG